MLHNPETSSLIILAVLWCIYFAIHSMFASLRFKHWIVKRYPRIAPWYRLAFNAIATVLLLPPLSTMWLLHSEPLWRWHGNWSLLAYLMMLTSVAGLFSSSNYYDMEDFLGIRQFRDRSSEVDGHERFIISPFHRYIRHPWYFFGLLLIWSQDMDPARLTSATLLTVYLYLGSMLEERKLIVMYGSRYVEYRNKVPGLIPRPWRFLSRQEAIDLQTRPTGQS